MFACADSEACASYTVENWYPLETVVWCMRSACSKKSLLHINERRVECFKRFRCACTTYFFAAIFVNTYIRFGEATFYIANVRKFILFALNFQSENGKNFRTGFYYFSPEISINLDSERKLTKEFHCELFKLMRNLVI